jgi:hypothetical protein
MALDAGYEGGEWFERHWIKFSRGDDDEYSEVDPRIERANVRIERRKENVVNASITTWFVMSVIMVNALHSNYYMVYFFIEAETRHADWEIM